MSTFSGLASKGEKGKSKFQSLDINSFFRTSRGESLEKQQQKSTVPLKHGMQSLGRVPARRGPVNLPSLKSEHSGSDAAVSLVPAGGPGWGKQDVASLSGSTPTSTTTTTSAPQQQQQQPQQQQAAAAAQPPTANNGVPAVAAAKHTATGAEGGGGGVGGGGKSWSSVMTGPTDLVHPPPYQSPQFQHEFPSLSSGDGGTTISGTHTTGGTEIQYGPGPSLRPQTEGSWIQGGSRPAGSASDGPQRSNSSGHSAVPPQLPVQAGQQQPPLPPQFRGVMPPFMYRNNFPPNGPLPTGTPPPTLNGRSRMDTRAPSRHVEPEELIHRPIIKEEDLNKMDDISRDMGWATHDDIDYNQKLAFSDDESPPEKETSSSRRTVGDKDQHKMEAHSPQDGHSRPSWSRGAPQGSRSRLGEDDEGLVRRRQQHSEEVAIAVERAKQRKEEEEKRFLESKQAAAKKLKELDEKIKGKRDKDADEMQGTINPSVVPPQPITPAPIPVPEWEKDKDSRARTPNEAVEEKSVPQQQQPQRDSSLDFKQLTKIEGNRNNYSRSAERMARERDQNGPNYNNRHFQSDLPPRFQKQRQNNPPSPASFQYENRWAGAPRKLEEKEREEDRKDYRRQGSDDGYRGLPHRSYTEPGKKSEDYRSSEHEEKRDREKIIKVERKQDTFDEDWHGDRRERYRDDRPQRPDSRDSRASRDSRQSRESEPREYGAWADVPFEPAYEEKKKEPHREDRRQVPGPITKERIEADDLKSGDKRNLTQLKRGQLPDKKIAEGKKDEKLTKDVDDSWNIKKLSSDSAGSKPWSDVAPMTTATHFPESQKFLEALEKPIKNLTANTESTKEEVKQEEEKLEKGLKEKRGPSSRNRSDRSQWGSGYSSHRTFSRRGQGKGGSRGGGLPRPSSAKGGEIVGTDSEGSVEEASTLNEVGKDEKGMKKLEKDEKNKEIKGDKSPTADRKAEKQDSKRDNYVPRGEPSRLGRGGYSVRRGGMSKKIDGYGPPPSKSPFGNVDDKERKTNDEMSGECDDKTREKQNVRKDSGQNLAKKSEDRPDRNKDRSRRADSRKGKPRGRDDVGEMYSDNSEEGGEHREGRGGRRSNWAGSNRSGQSGRRNPLAPRISSDKRGNYTSTKTDSRSDNKDGVDVAKSNEKPNDTEVNKENDNAETAEGDVEEKLFMQTDSDGFQEVKNKKTGKERLKEEKPPVKPASKPEKDISKNDRKPNKPNGTGPIPSPQQQLSSIPPLMATPVNPPVLPQPPNKGRFDRGRQNALPPRLMKQKENNRLQKAQMQQSLCEQSDIGKVGQAMGMYGMKDPSGVPVPISNAWDKPLTGQLRTGLDSEVVMNVGLESKSLDQVQSPNQNNSPSTEKAIVKGEKAMLDGTTPPVNTIIFENTNYKTPGSRTGRNDKSRKLEDGLDPNVITNFNKPISDLLNKTDKQESLQIGLNFSSKEDNADMKLDFLESEINHLTEDKSSKNLTAALNYKIASVKKVWESMSTGMDHNVGQDDNNSSFASSFGPDPNSLDPSGAFSKGTDTPDDNNDGYSPSPSQVPMNSTTNVCKVKPTQQVTSAGGPTVLNAAGGHQQQHSGIVGPSLMGHPLSPPPPMQPVLGGGGVGLGQPPQYTANQHLGYQAGLGGGSQYGMSAIPSPPTVLFNSTQPIQAAQTPGMYSHFAIEQAAGVIGGQGRSTYSQYPYNHLGQTAGSGHYSAQSAMYLQTAPQHPPPGAAQAPPDLYPNMNNYRLSAATGPFGQNQQLNNPTTVLISSTSNSLMSASVKPSQPISAIGTKAGGVGQAYQQQSQQGQQLYMAYDPTMQPNYLPSTGVLQRGPTGPVQNSVVPALQHSSSYYSTSTGGQTGYFQQPGNSTQLPQHQAGYGLQGNVFGTHSQSHTSPSLQGFGSHFLSTPIQIAAAAALNAQQQYRSQNLPNAYLKGGQGVGDQTGRSQQLKSPGGGQQEVLSSVFNSAPQIPSPKLRQASKQPPPQPSPTSQHKYNLYQSVGNQQGGQAQRFPAPIQRPNNYQPLSSMQNSGSANNQKHRSNSSSNKPPSRQYYTNQGSNLSAQNEKNEELKLAGTNVSTTVSNIVTSANSITTKTNVSTSGVNQSPDIVKENVKEETAALKD